MLCQEKQTETEKGRQKTKWVTKHRKNVLLSVKRFIDNIHGRRRKSWREKERIISMELRLKGAPYQRLPIQCVIHNPPKPGQTCMTIYDWGRRLSDSGYNCFSKKSDKKTFFLVICIFPYFSPLKYKVLIGYYDHLVIWLDATHWKSTLLEVDHYLLLLLRTWFVSFNSRCFFLFPYCRAFSGEARCT